MKLPPTKEIVRPVVGAVVLVVFILICMAWPWVMLVISGLAIAGFCATVVWAVCYAIGVGMEKAGKMLWGS